MSAATRTAIAAAASSVDGITCSPYFRQTTKAGDAMVRLDRITYPNNLGGLSTWQVLVLLPQSIEEAEKYLETKVTDLVAALWQEMTVSTVTPSEIVIDNGVRLPCVLVEGVRETD